jgi:hypothetical protein
VFSYSHRKPVKRPIATVLIETALDLGAIVLVGSFLLWTCNVALLIR